MARLSREEAKMLKRLQQRAEAPDDAPVGRTISAHVDLTDPKSIAAAIKHGFLSSDEVDDDDDDDDDDDPEDTPTRKGYFG